MLIGEVSKKSNLSKDGIRYYEKLGLIHSKPIRAGSKIYRDFDDDTFERLSIIALAKRLHFQLGELPEALDRLLSNQVSRKERTQVLKEKLVEVDAKIEGLISARNLLAEIAQTPEKAFVDTKLKDKGLWVE